MRSALGQAQRQDEALSKLIEWIEKGKVPTSQEVQGLPRLAWQLNNQLKSLQLLDCAENLKLQIMKWYHIK